MIIPVDQEWRIVSDAHCWTIQRKGADDKEGKPTWRGLKYLSTLPSALQELANLKIRLHKSETLEEAVSYINNVREDFRLLKIEIEERT